MIEHFLPQASSFAHDVDSLFSLITYVAGFWFIAAELVIFYMLFRFRRRDGVKAHYIAGTKKSEKKWLSRPHYLFLLCDIVLIVGAVTVWGKIKQNTLPPADLQIRVIGQQWAWTFVHPGVDGKLDTEDDIITIDDLHVVKDKTYHFLLESKDVVHSFSVPVFRLKQDAVPGRVITGWFQPILTGTFDIQCAEMCGIGHGLMGARITIETEADYMAWMKQQPKTGAIVAAK
ncbi:MAG: cytochrome C oxidase subunit II [Deltaproteobacteria bacterium RIFCSPLOWO2_02_FULL_44_10]|nr:MAG: cytochrome C oxidase subunit II [Deltaproteobacteria bacterium RIFCSPHIGHO2_02_FULL_44_16]OGQ47575.1 MAG: cytochrome C oxidase subunit II [Deltaproteobacteria bacterium RIFCSPLOWO2_02_FULL_44_10]